MAHGEMLQSRDESGTEHARSRFHMKQYDVSVIVPFRDHEEIIGTVIRKLSKYLREQELSFEIVAVDDDSCDNSQAVLALVRADHPELKVLHAPSRGLGFERGTREARGDIVWLIKPDAANHSLAAFERAYERVTSGDCDSVRLDRQFTVARRNRSLAAIDGLRGLRAGFPRLLARARSRRERDTGRKGWAAPLLAALSLTRPS